MLLEGKNAIVYGGGGAIGGAVARTFAREGATVHLAGRTQAKLDRVAADMAATGMSAHTAQVDALDEQAVDQHAAAVADRAGRIDICINMVGIDVGDQGVPLMAMSAQEFLDPITAYLRTNFVTARAVARHMLEARAGVILSVSPPMARMPVALSGPFGMAEAATEALCRQLAMELGPSGVRVVGLRLNGIPESAVELGSHTRGMWERAAERLGVPFERLLDEVGGGGPLPGPLTVQQVANAAAFLSSDQAEGMTATVANLTAGASID
ncbi:NAD(P)-dependent dehydrogenase (short-subunit alcohol dehydrogenase family) [Actinomadura luteofluorescens]|uniref:NAD(P)-dependent dehydrogenase (Short-subunit alcohol dehydrogenase family) n=2 Tax=Actinomadura luteofluorescens TaxID=46163 RepID=A0A7Y9EPP6_9ACTN|nr:SDR family oxidoreductase [Actinomadura luteofluorescens]NYD51641.1 NAD(P)-dependent dehydrogenase (short-subunit alcohol dehydrogenase family) [Actinomadura luteofluorescens]